MTHHDKGHFAAKHPSGTLLDPIVEKGIKEKSRQGSITCAAAHELAHQLNLSPANIGVAIDLMEYRIAKCQLGLFGYSPQKKIVTPARQVTSELASQIRSNLIADRLPCAAAWQLADDRGLSRLELSAACEALGIKVSPCQLGAF
jgi:hypothetical protein